MQRQDDWLYVRGSFNAYLLKGVEGLRNCRAAWSEEEGGKSCRPAAGKSLGKQKGW